MAINPLLNYVLAPILTRSHKIRELTSTHYNLYLIELQKILLKLQVKLILLHVL